MSISRLLRFILGVIIAGALLAFLLPFIGIPSSHFLPPARVYDKAQGETRGAVVSKYSGETGNPFHVGELQYFLNYEYRAHTPSPRGSTQPGPAQDYTGTTRVDKDTYENFPIPDAEKNTTFAANQAIPLDPYPVHVKYEKSYPDISGIDESWAATYQNGRSVGPGSNNLSGWLIWVVIAVIIGYFLAMLLETLMHREDI